LKFGDVRSIMAPPGPQKKDEKKDSPADQAPAFGASPKDTGVALVIRTAPDQFVIVGSRVVVLSAKARLGTIDEVLIEKGQQAPGRRMNGDETFSGSLFTLDMHRLEVRKVATYTLQ